MWIPNVDTGTQTVTQFVQAALADGATGLLQFQDGTPALTSDQWSELDTALHLLRPLVNGLPARPSGQHR